MLQCGVILAQVDARSPIRQLSICSEHLTTIVCEGQDALTPHTPNPSKPETQGHVAATLQTSLYAFPVLDMEIHNRAASQNWCWSVV